ncbi:MAG: RDD family protein [Candidatus Sulfotelmatobacter sp.]
MSCPLCGEICRCSSREDSTASPRSESETSVNSDASLHVESESGFPGAGSAPDDSSSWRQEVAARLNRYQSRRKPRAPRYPSLRLRFEPPVTPGIAADASTLPPVLTSNHALVLDEFAPTSPEPLDEATTHSASENALGFYAQVHSNPASTSSAATPVTAKIIEFPRSWTPPAPALDELADPVIDRPRILEVPEVVPSPPALGGITIEPVQQPGEEKRPGIDIPLQPAKLERRVLSAVIDDLIIVTACSLFAVIFWKLTGNRPPLLQTASVLAGLCFVLWGAYQYLLMVYAGTTPGLRLAGLKLLRFDDGRPSRRLRRWRVLASFLSTVSLCMGYIWVFLDEDSLCWHDRITHTYLAPQKHEPTNESAN